MICSCTLTSPPRVKMRKKNWLDWSLTTMVARLMFFFFLATLAQGQGPGNIEWTMPEEVGVGYRIGFLDFIPDYTFTFQDSTDLFQINALGEVRTLKNIDRESLTDPVIRLFVVGIPDNSQDKPININLLVTVLDINDNAPSFELDGEYERISFQEDARVNQAKSIVTASDPDASENGTVTNYQIVAGNDDNMFGLDFSGLPLILYIVKTGEENFDREKGDKYELRISARDNGTPPKFGYVTVDVSIIDVNDNTPAFDLSEYTTQVNESAPTGTSIFKAEASDDDIGLNGEVMYRLEDSTRQFKIEENTGVIRTLVSPLSCSRRCVRSTAPCNPYSCFITVEASDKGLNSLTGRTYVYVEILDENDHNPDIVFSYKDQSPVTTVTVDENVAIGTSVATISITDEDIGPNGQTSVRIIKGNEGGYFKHFSYSYADIVINEIQIQKQLDRETINRFNLTFHATDKGVPPRTSTSHLIILVNDANDHYPQFLSSQYEVTMSELSKHNSFVANVKAHDADEGVNSQLTYDIFSGNELGWFHIDPETGLVTTRGRLDHEKTAQVVLNVSTHDGGSEPKYNHTILTVDIQDENDVTPTFEKELYVKEMNENQPPGTPIVKVLAEDNDKGGNGSVKYSIHPDTQLKYPGAFSVSSSTGQVVAEQRFDREDKSNYIIKIIAQDGGTLPLSSTASIEVIIRDKNDNRPVFAPEITYVNVFDSDPVEVEVTRVSASDRDIGDFGKISYSLKDSFNNFAIDKSSGVISTLRQLQRQQVYVLLVTAVDGGGRTSENSATVNVVVTSTSSAAPVFTQDSYTFQVTEDSSDQQPQIGREVGKVEARPPSRATSPIVYAITGGDSDRIFQMDTIDGVGVISTRLVVDREEKEEYSLTVIAVAGEKISSRKVTIVVKDVNDNSPIFVTETTEANVLENWPVGHNVFLAQAVDKDSGVNANIVYALSSEGNSNNVFAIETNTGVISLAKSPRLLTKDIASLVVTAKDTGSPQRSNSMRVIIHVIDENDHTPMFLNAQYELFLSENQPVNQMMMAMTAKDSDTGRNGDLTYAIIRGNEDKKFGIFPDGSLYLAHLLDRETKDMFSLTVMVRDSAINTRSSAVNVSVYIQDENDNAPRFEELGYEFKVKENAKIKTFVGTVKATDADLGRNAEVIYSLQKGNSNFTIDPITGAIYTAKVFDREYVFETTGTSFYQFSVIASDNGLRKLQTKIIVKVIIEDENDSPPAFVYKADTFTVMENAAINDIVLSMPAVDADEGSNAAVTYAIVDGNDDDKFKIGVSNGEISLKRKLDREDIDQYRLTIRATDTGSTELQETDATIRIIVIDYNDNPPEFKSFIPYVEVKEDRVRGETLATFSGSDEDMGNNGRLRFDIVSGNEDDRFTLDIHSGKLYLARELDYEVERVHRLNITLSDSGFPALSVAKIFSLQVVDVNDNSPRFTDGQSRIQISEDKETNNNIAKLSAQDLDSGDFGAVKFSIFKQSPGGEIMFIIHPTDGQVTLKKSLDRETVESYELTIHAVDQDSDVSQRKTAEKSLTIIVGDVNDNSPVFQSPPVFLVPYPSSRGTTVAALSATDADKGDNSKIQFSFQGPKPPLFNINVNTGTISLAQTLPSSPLSYSLPVAVSDSDDVVNARTTTTTITLILYTSGGAGPQFSSLTFSPTIRENVREGTSIVKMEAAPSSPGLSLTYYITKVMGQGQAYGSLFKISSNGIISSAVILDREKLPASFTLDISAVETEGRDQRATTTQISVQLDDENDNAPIFTSSLFDASVPENGTQGVSVARVFMSDPDASGNAILALKGQDATNFNIDQNGVITTRQPLDYESIQRYEFEVEAMDGKFKSLCGVQINVQDVNDHRPTFSQQFYSFDLPEDAPKGYTVGKVKADDLDSERNGQVVYEMVSDWGREFFQISKFLGELTLIKEVDFEERQLYTLTVIARDEGSTPQSSEVVVYMNVKDVNDNQPEFDPVTYSREISEDAKLGTFVVNVSATDVDSGLNGVIRYSVYGEEAAYFGIGPINGSVYTTAPLDREEHPVYTLVVLATDQSPDPHERLSTKSTVDVKLKDVNDRQPQFTSPNSVGIRENSKVDSTVFTIQADDLDEGVNGQITFTLLSQTDDDKGDTFSLDSKTGALILESELDRERLGSYTLEIEAMDGGSNPMRSRQRLTVSVIDANDNAPDFTKKTYEHDVDEDVSVGTSLLRVLAQDIDEGFNGAVRYFIVGGAGRHDFHLDMSSGVLRVQKSLDYERTKSYTLTVQAEDSSVENPLHSNATVVISVNDVNDFVPVFDNSPYHTFVQEGLDSDEELPIFNITARDEDSGDNGLVQYALRNIINYSNLFRIDPLSGQVLMLEPLDREKTPYYVLTIIAIDSGTMTQTGSTTLTVFVKDVNDHSPVFESSDTYLGYVTENKPEGTDVLQISASDLDEGVNSRIVYTLDDNEPGHFRIQPHSGVIQTTGPLDRESQSDYMLTVVATDQGIPPRSATVKVKVVVNDDNDHTPDFGTKKYSVTIHDSSTADFVIGVTAIDHDVGKNGKVVYSLEGLDSSSFHINSETGVITHATSLKRTPRTFTFVVRASDLGNVPLNSTATVTVQLSATSPANRPVFNDLPSNLNIKENTGRGKVLTTVRATSATSSRITYHIAGGNVNNAFTINANNGSIIVASKIDYEVTNRFLLWIEARDQSRESVSTFQELTVDVEDLNDNSPTFSHTMYSKDLEENAELRFNVFKVTATDLDSGKNMQLVYRIKQGNTNNTFSIDTSTGLIRTANLVVDRETIPFYSLIVEAADMGQPKRTASTTVRITILDKNDNQPTFTGSRSVAVPEDLPLNSLVMQLTIRDKDIGENAVARFTLEDINGDILPFALDAASGNITNIRKLDAETQQRYRPWVSVTDSKYLSRTQLTISLLDVNDNPPKFQSSVLSYHFRELQAPGAKVGQLTALDLDISSPNNRFFFSLKRPSSLFELDAETGVIIALESFHFFGGKSGMESMNEHVLEAVVTDLGVPSLSSEATVTVHITDSNDHAPVFKKEKYFSAVPINLSSEETVIQVMASDDEDYGINAEIIYRISSGTGNNFFSINSNTGAISPKRSLSGRENQRLYIIVEAWDKGLPPKMASATVELEITPVNTQSPKFNSDPFSESVSEDAEPGHAISTIRATDADNGLNGKVLYSISAGNEMKLFEIEEESGILKVRGKLDYERQKIHTITITARDRGLFYKHVSRNFTIVLEDVNDNAPQFEHPYYDAYIKENGNAFSFVFKVTAFDIDTDPTNREIRYSIKGAVDSEDYFRINEATGDITSSSHIFDYEKRSLYTLFVMAYNSNSGSSSALKKSLTTVYVHITGENEYIPRFVKNYYSFQISESSDTGTSVGSVSAVDKDKGPEGVVYYYLEGQSNLLGFSVEALSGIIRVAKTADYESSHYVTLRVLAKNWGSVQGNDTDLCTVNITISDANDPPEFSKDRYVADIDENSEGFLTVIQVYAEDKDIQPSNREFTYDILRGNEQGKFRITQDGIIETTGLGRLDREITPVFELIVGAQDSGSPPRLGSATVEVRLNDVNDNGPQFDPFDLTVHVSENETSGVLVTTLKDHTTDLDLPGNQGPYIYQMLESAATKYFRITAESGRVVTKQRLNREESPKFLVPVVVTDSGRPRSMSSTLTFTIIVQDVNNSPPKPRPLTLAINIFDKGQIKGKVADIRPLDSDLTGKYSCSIIKGNTANFFINNGCDLEVAGDIRAQVYSLTVRASDGKFDPVEYEITIVADTVSNLTLESSLALKLKSITASNFLETGKYLSFQKAVQEEFGSSFSCKVFSLKEDDGDLYVMLYVHESKKQPLTRADLVRGLSGSISRITMKIEVEIDSFCSSNQCANNGECYTTASLASGNLISSSSSYILTSSNIALTPICVCKNPFTGPLCKDRQQRCGDDYCHNSGTCVNGKCQCTDEWKGKYCQEDVDECETSNPVCRNNGICVNLEGSFECRCPKGYHGRLCELQNYCANDPCAEHGTCVERVNSYECRCDYGYHGQRCQFSSMSFGENSYAEFPPVDNYATFNASLYVATIQKNALLMFSPILIGHSSHGFVAMEIIDGHVEVSFRLNTDKGRNGVITLSISDVINTGKWHRLEFMKNAQTATLVVQECEHTCKLCDRGQGCYNEVQVHMTEEEVWGRQLSLGGVRQFSDIENQGGDVRTFNFVGCMHSVAINSKTYGISRFDSGDTVALSTRKVGSECPRQKSSNLCDDSKVCYNDGHCENGWTKPTCQCVGDYTGPSCQTASQPFSLGPSGVIKFSIKESFVRQKKLDKLTEKGRKKRALAASTVMIRFRTTKDRGMLYSSQSTSASCLLWFSDGSVHFLLKTTDAVNDPLTLSDLVIADGKWHNVTVTSDGSQYTLDFDEKTSQPQDFGKPYDFDSLDILDMSISGQKTLPDNSVMNGLDGCLSKFLINGNKLPLNGSSSKYSIEVTGGVQGECAQLCDNNPCGGDNKCVPNGEVVLCHYMAKEAEGLETGIIVVIVFIVILIIAVIIFFILFNMRRDLFHNCVKMKKENHNSNMVSTSNGKGMSNSDSMGTNGGLPHYRSEPTEEEIIRNHIVGELTGQKSSSLTARPDLIGSSYSPQMLSDGVMIMDPDDMQVMMGEEGAPEHYDFENASSIAPSDIAPSDMIRHYRDFRNGKQPHHHHHHKHHQHHNQLQPHGSHYHLFNKYRDSPTNMSASNYRGSPHNPQFPRQSPISLTGSALSVPTHSSPHMAPNVNGGRPSSALASINQTSRARLSPLTQLHVRSPRSHPHNTYSGNNNSNNYGSNNLQDSRGSRSNSIGSHHSHSSSSSATTVPSGFPPNSNLHKSGKSRTPKGLTVEDVNRLNARPDMLLHDPAMSSVDGRGKRDKSHHHHIPPHPAIEGSLLLEPPDSSSDDSGANDSFTCSEFEYDNDPARARLDLDPSKMIFSKLTEVDNECDDLTPQVVKPNPMLEDGLNSNGDSFASTNASSSNSPSTPVCQPISSQYDFDALLNWGPNFDKLVGVFSDIAQLPDSGHAVVDGELDHTYEEYV